jgi:hypothetical protein
MTTAVPAGAVRARLRRARRGHHDRPLGDLLSDVYLIVLLVVGYGFAIVSNTRRYLHLPAAGTADPGGRYWLGVAAIVAGAGAVWLGLRSVGPLLVSPAGYVWVVSTPVDRARWLRPRLAALLPAAAAVGAGLALAVGGVGLRSNLGWAALAGAAYGAAGTALAVAGQAAAGVGGPAAPDRVGPGDQIRAGGRVGAGDRVGELVRRWAGAALALTGGVVAAVVIVAHYVHHAVARPTTAFAPVVAVVGLPLAAAAAGSAFRALPRLDRFRLTSGAQLAFAAVTAVVWLDPSVLAGVLETRRWRQVGRVRGRPFRTLPRGRAGVLMQAERRRLRRRPGALAAFAALVLAQYAVAVAVPPAVGVAQLVGAYVAADRFAGGLRTICRLPGLRRSIGGSDLSLRLVHLVVPTIGATVWWLLTTPAGPGLRALDVVFVAGVVAAVYRAASRAPMSYDGATVDTPFGLVPVELIRQVVRGPDVLLLMIVLRFLTG